MPILAELRVQRLHSLDGFGGTLLLPGRVARSGSVRDFEFRRVNLGRVSPGQVYASSARCLAGNQGGKVI